VPAAWRARPKAGGCDGEACADAFIMDAFIVDAFIVC
jgi:hypothetical protein